MITYVLTVSQKFPTTHKKAGQSTGFQLAIKHYDKIHTIRGNYDLWAKRFEKMIAGGGSAVAYAWYVWQKGFNGTTELKWFN